MHFRTSKYALYFTAHIIMLYLHLYWIAADSWTLESVNLKSN